MPLVRWPDSNCNEWMGMWVYEACVKGYIGLWVGCVVLRLVLHEIERGNKTLAPPVVPINRVTLENYTPNESCVDGGPVR